MTAAAGLGPDGAGQRRRRQGAAGRTPPVAGAADGMAAPRADRRRAPPRSARAAHPLPVLRLRHLLNSSTSNRPCASRCRACWRRSGARSTRPRCSPTSASARGCRCAATCWRARPPALLPGTPETTDLAELFQLLFEPGDAAWLERARRRHAGALPNCWAWPEARWRATLLDAITILVSAVHASGYTPAAPAHGPRLLATTNRSAS
jgi:hypothetical protein